MKTFLITYTIYDSRGVVIESKVMRVKRKENEFMAKVSLEAYLKRKHPNFYKLTIHSCEGDIIDFFDLFK